VLVEVLTFTGCPHGGPALELARATVAELAVEADVRLVSVAESETGRYRFLGSPSIRVDGEDIEPNAGQRLDYAHSCRLYQTPAGPRPLPEAAWLRARLVAALHAEGTVR
jgi:hypothetical protein